TATHSGRTAFPRRMRSRLFPFRKSGSIFNKIDGIKVDLPNAKKKAGPKKIGPALSVPGG
ncbi:MAG: hypothetical protein M0017_04055, partial [Desulfobacteraceae bacterium]|nr:hypothetical protein [Desulfobacteraceae bacterium]